MVDVKVVTNQGGMIMKDLLIEALLVAVLLGGMIMIGLMQDARPTVEQVISAHPTWSRYTCQRVAQGKIWPGMTAEQARASWRAPTRINLYNSGTLEQWVYESGGTVYYVYFRSGILTSWTELGG